MQLSIRHETTYAYSAPLAYTIQQLHLTPRIEPQQRALSWQMSMPGQCNAYTDAYGNLSHMLTINGRHDSLLLLVQGIVETVYPYQGRLNAVDHLSPLLFTVPTRLTAAAPAILDLAATSLPARQQAPQTRHVLRLAEEIVGAVIYQSGATMVTSTALDALQLGRGVCQDHAHLYLACCHAWGIPARYVSGYIDPETTGHAASHAWVDVWVEDSDFSGWVSIDVTHARLMTDAYCRLAIGRDYDSAAPIRGVRSGGGNETMTVDVKIVPL
ncbi:transglutaminase family protein [Janthinobacterium agaricidamnosum]|uniref:Transglutaminase-like superfamily protein n=1 Tax=Janthinobacterium agaricidamnosum NBRC 102515 = DSM 9628 TaxID=1349767 RepID=W0V6J3_9BURK|nr:transglutaminase family protein [Janthinobacterium agaricidamnosum]CDG83240.1 transglutaminase-like superfamily protein [Janthinobacterium agaricidamnosum NBRC 102515 = DSM 9628]